MAAAKDYIKIKLRARFISGLGHDIDVPLSWSILRFESVVICLLQKITFYIYRLKFEVQFRFGGHIRPVDQRAIYNGQEQDDEQLIGSILRSQDEETQVIEIQLNDSEPDLR